MMEIDKSLEKVIVAFTAPDQDRVHFAGIMVGHHAHPVNLIDTGDGVHRAWATHLCRLATHEEAVDFWRRRALSAEAGRGKVNNNELLHRMVDGLHAMVFGTYSIQSGDYALKSLGDGGEIHEYVHAMLRLTPARVHEQVEVLKP